MANPAGFQGQGLGFSVTIKEIPEAVAATQQCQNDSG
jgi:hypothetical protein